MSEQHAIISGITTDDLKQVVIDYQAAGWSISEQNYTGEDLWELILVKYLAQA